MIFEAVAKAKDKATGRLLGISGGASGGDILFHEVCEELNIPSQMYLVLPKSDYIKESVADSGADWIERFNGLYEKLKPKFFQIRRACHAGCALKRITIFGSVPISGFFTTLFIFRRTI